MNALPSDIQPINGPARYPFKFANLKKANLIDWPPAGATKFGYKEALSEMNLHWEYLSKQTIWSPYPVFSYCAGMAEGPISNEQLELLSPTERIIIDRREKSDEVKVRYFLFPMADAQYQAQALAQVICETRIGAKADGIKAWVDALSEEELDEDNRRELKYALEDIAIKEMLDKFIGRKCWFADGTLEIRKSSDAEIVGIEGGDVIINHFLGEVIRIPLSQINAIREK